MSNQKEKCTEYGGCLKPIDIAHAIRQGKTLFYSEMPRHNPQIVTEIKPERMYRLQGVHYVLGTTLKMYHLGEDPITSPIAIRELPDVIENRIPLSGLGRCPVEAYIRAKLYDNPEYGQKILNRLIQGCSDYKSREGAHHGNIYDSEMVPMFDNAKEVLDSVLHELRER